jgi:hypothetical protein
MSTLILELPDEHIQVLQQLAHQRGTSIDMVVADLINSITVHGNRTATVDDDPIYNIKAHEPEAPTDSAEGLTPYHKSKTGRTCACTRLLERGQELCC